MSYKQKVKGAKGRLLTHLVKMLGKPEGLSAVSWANTMEREN